MIDSHCHLADKAFTKDLSDVILRAKEAGVEAMVSIADSLQEASRCIEIADEFDDVYCTVGVHPHNASQWEDRDDQTVKLLVQSSDKVKAIGEIGLDYYYDNSPRDIQREVFEKQLLLAKELALPAVIHCREAVDDVIECIKRVDPESLVIHCCTEKFEDVKPLVEKGYLLSFTGIATYPKSDEIRRTIQLCPLKQMMVETDAPYLSPQTKRGKRCEPAFVRETLQCIADVKGCSFEEAEVATTAVTRAFYGM